MKTKTLTEIKFMILSAPDVASANKIISDHYDFTTFEEKIAFLKGMFSADALGKTGNTSAEAVYLAMLNNILSSNILDTKAVKKTLSIPAWLNDVAVENNINFSQTLQEALKEKLGLK